MKTIFYAHTWSEIEKRKMSDKEREQDEEDEELNKALEEFFQDQLARVNLRLITTRKEASLKSYKRKETELIKNSIGLIAVVAREGKSKGEGVKRELRKARRFGRPRMVLYDEENVSIEFTTEFLPNERLLSKEKKN